MRKAECFFRAGWLAATAAGLALAVSGCGSGDSSSGKSGSASKKIRKATPGAADPGLADMVTAVSASRPGPPVEMKFALPARPEVGQVTDLQVAVIPLDPVPDTLAVSFRTADGIEIVAGGEIERLNKLVGGAAVRHVVKIIPKRDGIFAVTAVVSFTQANQDLTRTFSIPVITGEGLPDQVAKGP